MFFEIAVLKNSQLLLRKYLCWSIFLTKLQASRPTFLLKRDSNTGKFFEILCDDRIFSMSFGTKLTFFIIPVPLLWFPPWFRTCFHTKIFSKCKFRTHHNVGSSTILIELVKFRKNSRIAVSSPSNLLWKLWLWVFLNIILCYYFSLEAVLQAVSGQKTNQRKSSGKLKHVPAWKLAGETM